MNVREIKRELVKRGKKRRSKRDGDEMVGKEAEQHEPHPYLGIARCIVQQNNNEMHFRKTPVLMDRSGKQLSTGSRNNNKQSRLRAL